MLEETKVSIGNNQQYIYLRSRGYSENLESKK